MHVRGWIVSPDTLRSHLQDPKCDLIWKQGLSKGIKLRGNHQGGPLTRMTVSFLKEEMGTQRQTHIERRWCKDPGREPREDGVKGCVYNQERPEVVSRPPGSWGQARKIPQQVSEGHVMLTPGFWTVDLQNHEIINWCCVSLWSFVKEAIGTNREAIRVHVDIPYLRKPPNCSTFMVFFLLFILY